MGADEPDCYRVDSGISSAGTIPGLEKVLGLKHIDNPDVKAVAQLNNTRAGESIKQKPIMEETWKAQLEKRLESGPYLGGQAANDEDKKCHMMLTTPFNSEGLGYTAPTTETHPNLTKWMEVMKAA